MTVTVNLTSPGWASIVTGVATCVIEALAQTPAGAPSRQCHLIPTQQIAHDDCDCGGQIGAAIKSVYGSQQFPTPYVGADWKRCGPRFEVANVVLSVARCVPTINSQGIAPSCDAVLAAAITLENDRTATRQAIACCLADFAAVGLGATPRLALWSLGASNTVGELGGCSAVETEFWIAAQVCLCPD